MEDRKKQERNKMIRVSILALLLGICLSLGFLVFRQSDEVTVEKGNKVKVIDVSSWNKTIQWRKVKKEGIYYAMLRIGVGQNGKISSKQDAYFKRNYRSGKFHRMRMGVYFYSYATTVSEAKTEAKDCLSLLQKNGISPDNLELPVAYDLEEDATFATGRENTTRIAVAFCEEIKKAGFTPMIYSSSAHLNRYFQYRKVKDYQIWVAHYGVEETGPSFVHPYHMWQYTCTGIVPGANTSEKDDVGDCDINYYYVQ